MEQQICPSSPKLSEENKKKIIIHDISDVINGIAGLYNVQKTLWEDAEKKYDIVVHADIDEFIVSDVKSQSFRDCLEDFYESSATFSKVLGYECTLSLDRQICDSDDIVSMATRGRSHKLFDRPCIFKSSEFEKFNLDCGRHYWDPKGNVIKWNRNFKTYQRSQHRIGLEKE